MMVNDVARLDTVFRALASAPRRQIVARLSAGERTVSELAAPLRMSPPAVSRHLRVLEKAGVIKRLIRGRTHHLSLDSGPLDAVATWLENHGARWTRALDALAGVIEEPDEKDTTR